MGISTILSLLSSIASVLVKFMGWLHDQKLVESGKAQQKLDALKGQIHDEQVAIAAREAVRANLAANPDGVSDDDPFRRD